MQRKNEVTIVFCFFSHAKKQVFFKNIQNQRAKLIFSKKWHKSSINGGVFQQVLWTWNENPCERSKKIEVEDRIQNINVEDEETILDFPMQYENLWIFEANIKFCHELF